MSAATIVPLLALAAIVAVLYVAWPRPSVPRKTVPWEGRTRPPEEARRVREHLRDALSRTLYGEALARDLWAAVMAMPPGEGAILHAHRDYCGHGLIRTEAGIKLCEIQDGGHSTGAPIAEWSDEADFIAFLARQSDYSCSGWDPSEPVFFTTDEWACNNQRLTRENLLRFLDGLPPGP